jgi:hypothetical protein
LGKTGKRIKHCESTKSQSISLRKVCLGGTAIDLICQNWNQYTTSQIEMHIFGLLGTLIRNYGDVFHSLPSANPVIPAKAGIQNLSIPRTTVPAGLDTRVVPGMTHGYAAVAQTYSLCFCVSGCAVAQTDRTFRVRPFVCHNAPLFARDFSTPTLCRA